jgi:hypothetical protein
MNGRLRRGAFSRDLRLRDYGYKRVTHAHGPTMRPRAP